MADTSEAKKTIWVVCESCGYQQRNHRILHQKVKRITENPYCGSVIDIEYHRFVECMGCESLKYVTSSFDPLEMNPNEREETNFKVYPDAPVEVTRRKPTIALDDLRGHAGTQLIPDAVWKMYKETSGALSHGIRTLAAGGLRATVEAICLDLGISNGDLQQKINKLATRDFLTATQAKFLHEERYLGNAALHELETPSAQAIKDGLGIVEGLINTIYILPDKASRLRTQREST